MFTAPDRAAILARVNAAQTSLIARLHDLPAAAAEGTLGDNAWNAAQIGWHVALTHTGPADHLAQRDRTGGREPAST